LKGKALALGLEVKALALALGLLALLTSLHYGFLSRAPLFIQMLLTLSMSAKRVALF